MDQLQQSPVTWAILVLNVGIFLWAQAQGDTTQADTLIRFGATERRRIWAGESWRLLTSCFLHIGWMHLIWNSYGMFGWCQHVEQELGSMRFAMAYLVTGIGASAVSVLGHAVVGAGASGSGFGMIGIALVIAFRHLGGWGEFLKDSYVLHILLSMGVWMLLGVFILRMDNYAHVGGLVFGVLIGWAMTLPSPEADGMRTPAFVGVVGVWLGVVGASLYPRFARRDRDSGGS